MLHCDQFLVYTLALKFALHRNLAQVVSNEKQQQFRCIVYKYVQANNQLPLHLACSRTGPGTIQIVQQILRWSSKDCRLTADKVND